MKTTIIPSHIGGKIDAIPSKSHAHRLLICAALASGNTNILCSASSEDIEATVKCLKALGSSIERNVKGFTFKNSAARTDLSSALSISESGTIQLNCGESGSTYRFLFPVVCALNSNFEVIPDNILSTLSHPDFKGFEFVLQGRLPKRPMEPLFSVLEEHGVEIKGKNTDKVSVLGKLCSGKFMVPGNISSQFISGLIFALPMLKSESVIEITGKIESKKYIDITIDAVRSFGIDIMEERNLIIIPGNQKYVSLKQIEVEGDWSNSAFWLCCAALSGKSVTCNGLNINSLQGDKYICKILELFGCRISAADKSIMLVPEKLHGINLNASQIPDLVPAVAAVAAGADGITKITNAQRLRIKESNRLNSISQVLGKLGADITETTDGLIIKGKSKLKGGKVDSWADHRIAMMAAITSVICENPVEIDNSQAVNKSYPGFFDDFRSLGGKIL